MRLCLAVIILFAIFTGGCKSRLKKTDWTVTLSAGSKSPYGAIIAGQSMVRWFPEARTEHLSPSFRYEDLYSKLTNDSGGPSVLILFGLNFYVANSEWSALQEWAESGNDVVIFASRWDPKITRQLRLDIPTVTEEEQRLDSALKIVLKNQAVWLHEKKLNSYTHPGRSIQGYFENDTNKYISEFNDVTWYVADMDSPDAIGWGSKGVNCLRYGVGDGSITIHAAPLVVSNYFLLQGENRRYLDDLFSTITPQQYGTVYWQDYYKRSGEPSSWGVLWRHSPTRWAILTLLATALIFLIFELKRRQRIIPVVKPLSNTSVLFAETVGRLYYSKGDHANLAQKMVQQSLENIRGRYRIPTEVLNEAFTTQLARKSGRPYESVAVAVDTMNTVRTGEYDVSEERLKEIHQTLQPFLR